LILKVGVNVFMAKKNKQQQKQQQKKTAVANYEVQDEVRVPDILNIDTLAYISDDDLRGVLSNLYNELDSSRKTSSDTWKLWETEIAYVLREQGIRRNRQRAHEDWSRNNTVVVIEEFESNTTVN
jgi:transcriptional regulator of aromatic amino acid metabolism